MNSSREPYVCPECGVAMNCHAEKLVVPTDVGVTVDAVFGGAIEEAHACPQCGRSSTRLRANTRSDLRAESPEGVVDTNSVLESEGRLGS